MISDECHAERTVLTDVSTRREESPSPSTPEGRNTRRGTDFRAESSLYTADADANMAGEAREAAQTRLIELLGSLPRN